jgi:Flp pilus assembly pilin Flp
MIRAFAFLTVTAGDLRRRAFRGLAVALHGETGATAAEYAVLIALIAAIIFAGAQLLGTNVNGRLNDMGTDLASF